MLNHSFKLRHVRQSRKGFGRNTGETDKRTGMSVALLLAILAFRVRITAEEREENHEGADSAQ